MITLRIVTTIEIPEGVDTAFATARFQDLVEEAIRSDGLVSDDSDVLFDAGIDDTDQQHETPWFQRQQVLDGILAQVELPNGEIPTQSGHWVPGQDGQVSLVVSIGPKPTDLATLSVRFAGNSTTPSEVSCRDHKGQNIAKWNGAK